MRKLLWVLGAAVALIVIILLGLTIYIKSYLQSDRLKGIIIPRLEAATGRKVTIGEIDVSIFKGVIVKEMSIKGPGGNGDFISAKEFILAYQLLPLLKRQLIIDKIELDSPHIFVKKEKDGSYNFSDISSSKPAQGQPKATESIPFTLVADSISVRGATLSFADSQKRIPDVTADIPDISLKASMTGKDGAMSMSGHVTIRSAKAVLNGIPTDTSGRIDITDRDITLALTTTLGADSIKLSGPISNFRSAPDARIDMYSKHLDLDKLIPPGAGQRAAAGNVNRSSLVLLRQSGEYEFRIYLVTADQKNEVKASGQIRIDAMRYSGYDLKDFSMGYRYNNSAVTLSPLQVNIAGGQKINAAGSFKGDMTFTTGSEGAAAIKRTLVGKGVIDMTKAEVKNSKITDAIAVFTGLDELRNPRFDRARFDMSIRDQKALIQGSANSSLMVISPSGTVGFDKRIDMMADLKLAPTLASKLTRGANIGGYFKDKEGWTTVPLKISGTTDKPSVGMNTAAMGKQLQKGIQGEVQKRLGGQSGGKPQDLLKGLFGK